MIRRLARDESGMTMGLTVIMIVLIGVMGAGLLTFVRNDLGAVIESNQGQTAFNLADAGTQAAKRHLLLDANIFRYDGTTGNGESPWACVPDANNVCTSTSGKVIDLDTVAGTETRVWIKYLLPATSTTQLGDPNYAPELVPAGKTNYEFGRDFFRVISEGTAGNARRKVEAIYQTYDLGAPRAYYTPGNITLAGTADITNISLFTQGNVTIDGNPSVAGEDNAYGNWLNPPWNTRGRTNAAGNPVTAAGIGAVGTISPANRKVAFEDYDSTTTPRFIKKVPPDATQTTSQITFPFNYEREPDLEMMRNAAKLQGNYYEVTGTLANLEEAGVGSGPKWAANSTISTVVFVKFTNAASMATNKLTWDVDAAGTLCDRPPVLGTLVIENGIFDTTPNKAPLKGTIVIKGAGPGNLVYTDEGTTCMQSFVHATGDMRIAGTIQGFTEERGNRPGFYGVSLWSWRECYSATCSS